MFRLDDGWITKRTCLGVHGMQTVGPCRRPTDKHQNIRKEHLIRRPKIRVRISAACFFVLAATVLAVGLGTATGAPAKPAPTKITVKAGEFYFKLSETSIAKPGTVQFTVINEGTIAHDFEIQQLNKTTKLLQPKQKQVLTVTFTKAGSYYYLCTVPRHAQEGMAGNFTVK